MPLMRMDAGAVAEPAPGAGDLEQAKVAASPPAVTADVPYVLGAYALVAAAGGLAILLWWWRNPTPLRAGDGISVFGPLYILAQAIERFIEPFSTYLGAAKPDGGGRQTKPAAAAKVLDAVATGNMEAAAKWQRVVDRIRRNTAVITWAIASALGMILCGLLGLYFMRLIGFTDVPRQIDVLISGLAVGSGTKPLHDLIANVQRSKEQKEDPPERQTA